MERTCLKASKEKTRRGVSGLLAAAAGLFALVWFLLRVIPRPSRAAYPCQRLAAPMASGFVLWLAGLVASAVAHHRVKVYLRRSLWFKAAVCAVVLAAGCMVVISSMPRRGASTPHGPLGVGKGIYPGRVVWVHNSAATDWEGPGDGHWWEASHTNQDEVDRMMSSAIRGLTGASSDAAAWDALFRSFNQTHGRGDLAYQAGEKIAIKVNFVGTVDIWGCTDPETYDLLNLDYMNTSPQVILALLRQLINVAGVPQADISVGDPTALFPNQFYNPLHAEFPYVKYLDRLGKFGRTKVTPSEINFYFSARPTGVTQDKIPLPFAEATYFINLANLKSHTTAGVTLCGKNCYGYLRFPTQTGYYDLHESLPYYSPGSGRYRAVVDLMGHAQSGGKALLYLIDGLYAGVHPIEYSPRKWLSPPFNDNWTSSLFASQDPVAIDSVGFDFLYQEWSDYPHMSGADDYLHEAALADDPPSGVFYDPDHATNTTRLSSLGTHEHWNDSVHRQYSRNLGLNEGIELLSLTCDDDSPADAKLSGSGGGAFLPNAVVTAIFPGAFYVESDDRSSGIRVQATLSGLSVGRRVNVRGQVFTDPASGERYLAATSTTLEGSGSVSPLGLINRSVGGGDWHYDESTLSGQKGVAGACGLNNIGLLVRASGKFTKTGTDRFTLDDGSGAPLNCIVPGDVVLNSDWSHASAAGISSCEIVNGQLRPLLRVRGREDIAPL